MSRVLSSSSLAFLMRLLRRIGLSRPFGLERRDQMKLSALFLLVVYGLFSTAAMAQDPNAKTSGSSINVTGCLEKGSTSNDYNITGSDGKQYALRSSSVELAPHLGHKVTVTGSAEAGKGSGDARPGADTAMHAETLDVSSLTMVSASCK